MSSSTLERLRALHRPAFLYGAGTCLALFPDGTAAAWAQHLVALRTEALRDALRGLGGAEILMKDGEVPSPDLFEKLSALAEVDPELPRRLGDEVGAVYRESERLLRTVRWGLACGFGVALAAVLATALLALAGHSASAVVLLISVFAALFGSYIYGDRSFAAGVRRPARRSVRHPGPHAPLAGR
jgi:hypothetical protein